MKHYAVSQCVHGASRGTCIQGDHYCNDSSMAASLTRPQAIQLIQCYVVNTDQGSSPPKYNESAVTYLSKDCCNESVELSLIFLQCQKKP